jgi:ABC-2 type transport system permease protein
MRNFLLLWRRELAAYFLSPIAYVTTIVFLIATGGTFLSQVFINEGRDEQLSIMLFASIVAWLTVLVTVISMRLFVEETRSGNIEALMTAPVSETEVVLGKYAGALTFLLVVLAPAVACIFVLNLLSPGIVLVDVDPGAVLGGCLILFLLSAFWTSIGITASLTAKSQIVAAICCFGAIWFILLLSWVVTFLPFSTETIVEYVSIEMHTMDFARGSMNTRPIVMYLSGTAFMLFLAVRILESRRWR